VQRKKINPNEIESQTVKDPQDRHETRRSLPVWQLLCVRPRTLPLLVLRLQEVGLPPYNAVAASANAGAALAKSGSIFSINRPMMHTCSEHALELKVPPVALVIGVALLMWLAAACTPGLNVRFPFQPVLGWVVGLLGISTCILGVAACKRAKTTVNPTKPELSSSLVTSGIYRCTRNPMYFGFLLMLTGWAAARANMVAFLALPAFVLYMNQFQIKPEERALLSIFGHQFRAYCSNVRRWI
jgi:protein-S-isoprenylcysteine O-methyltransferase Ste14